MKNIISEFHYWDYGIYARTALDSRPEIDSNELRRIGETFNVKVEVRKASLGYLTLMKIGWRFPRYNKIIIRVIGDLKEDVRACLEKILLLYGRPDEVPLTFFSERRAGRIIIQDLLKEFKGGKK